MKGLSYRLNRAPLMSWSRDFIHGNDVHIFMLMIPRFYELKIPLFFVTQFRICKAPEGDF